MLRSCCARLVDALCRCFRWAGSSIDGDLGQGQHHDVSLNIVLNGECGVGKTSLRNRWVDDVFTGDVSPTFGVDFNMKTLCLVRDQESPPRRAAAPSTGHDDDDDLKVKINIYDTSGKPGYREVNSAYMLSFDAMVFVYDISSKRTLNNLRRYLNDPEHRERLEGRRKAGMAMILVGNKCELPLSERQVGSQTGQDVATELGVPFMEVSAKSGTNVHKAFMSVITKAVGEHLAREDRKSGGAGVNLKRTGKEVGGIQRAWGTRASALELFKGMKTPRRKLVLRTEPEAPLLASPPEKEETKCPSFAATATARPVKVAMGARSEGTVTADVKGDEPAIRNGDDRCPLLVQRPCSPPTRMLDTRGAAPAVKQCSAGFRKHHHPLPTFETSDSSATRTFLSPPAAAAEGREGRSRSRSLVHSGGPRDVDEGQTSPGRRGVSPIGRSTYPHEFDWYSNSGGEKRPYTVGRWPRSPDALNVYSAKTSEEPFRIRSPRGGESGTSRPRPSSLSPRRSRGPVHFSPRVQLSSGRNASSSSSPSPRGGGRSLFAKVDESVITTESAATSLRKLSSFWLDQWGIKEQRTDASRQRRARIRVSSSLSPPIGTYQQSPFGRTVSSHSLDPRALGGR